MVTRPSEPCEPSALATSPCRAGADLQAHVRDDVVVVVEIDVAIAVGIARQWQLRQSVDERSGDPQFIDGVQGRAEAAEMAHTEGGQLHVGVRDRQIREIRFTDAGGIQVNGNRVRVGLVAENKFHDEQMGRAVFPEHRRAVDDLVLKRDAGRRGLSLRRVVGVVVGVVAEVAEQVVVADRRGGPPKFHGAEAHVVGGIGGQAKVLEPADVVGADGGVGPFRAGLEVPSGPRVDDKWLDGGLHGADGAALGGSADVVESRRRLALAVVGRALVYPGARQEIPLGAVWRERILAGERSIGEIVPGRRGRADQKRIVEQQFRRGGAGGQNEAK